MANTSMCYGAPPLLFERARKLRDPMTGAEKKLMHYLKDHQQKGYKFRRQHPIKNLPDPAKYRTFTAKSLENGV